METGIGIMPEMTGTSVKTEMTGVTVRISKYRKRKPETEKYRNNVWDLGFFTSTCFANKHLPILHEVIKNILCF
jgi:REP element-mobilizing transposase RayT